LAIYQSNEKLRCDPAPVATLMGTQAWKSMILFK